MELTIRNCYMKMKVIFYSDMVKIESSYVLHKKPSDIDKRPCKYKVRKNGKVDVKQEIFIPNSVIFDAMSIDDDVKKKISDWFSKFSEEINKSREEKNRISKKSAYESEIRAE